MGTDKGTINQSPRTATGPSGIYSGISTYFGSYSLMIDPAYVPDTPIISSATFPGTSLLAMGMTSTGLVGTWSLVSDPLQQIQVRIGSAPPSQSSAVPGPLPLAGAGAAFAFSRRLRRRVALGQTSSSKP